jgi:4a-hydroxytetrahydrobiopterin dehydratase
MQLVIHERAEKERRMTERLLSSEEQSEALSTLPGWKVREDGKALTALYRFADFMTALDFINQISVLAEEANHHPDFGLGWGYVRMEIQTHTVNGITEKDVTLARQISLIRRIEEGDE